MWLPGGKLEGEETPFTPAAAPQDNQVLQLETNPARPYSVNIGYQMIEGRVFIDPAAERTWYQHIADNPSVRIRFAGHDEVHPAQAVDVTDETLLGQFDPSRIVLELVPRQG